ncbi:ubiquinol-cytochrome c reductase iron-sulfur subunit [Robertkochia aurantiaca]|uniref:QcrA and Rieske domain-containing protein n=1 Tax=Robertkochia aurantiaca TaxID=2873700 RepID=UPI001CCF80A7|nr:Rieske 2Fe-2S domain-containing protein [Robertkochia sp. 3YJGBD-33]
MERKDFLRSLGSAAALALILPCAACSSPAGDTSGQPEDQVEDPTSENELDFTIDLSSQDAEPLQEPGGYIIMNETVVVRNLAGDFVAATRRCPHEGNYQIVYDRVNNTERFWCDVHGSRFDLQGKPVNDITTNTLLIYQTELSGNTLRVFNP